MEVKKNINRLFSLRIGEILEEIKWEFLATLVTHQQSNRKNKSQKITIYLINLLKIQVVVKYLNNLKNIKKSNKWISLQTISHKCKCLQNKPNKTS